MEFVVCLFRKSFQGGQHWEYVLVEKTGEEKYIDYAMESWGESSDGGHSYGYTVYCEEVIEKPTQEVIDYLTKGLTKKIEYLQSSIDFNKNKIEYLYKMGTRKLPKKEREIYERVKNGEPLYKYGTFGTTKKQFVIGSDPVSEKIVNFLVDRKYLKQGMIEIGVGEDREQYKYEYHIDI